MIQWITFRWKQHQIERWIDSISRAHDKAQREARARGATADELHELGHKYHFEHRLAADEVIRLTSAYYVRMANRMLIPVPEFKTEGGAWMESQETGLYHLTPHALHELRAAIRTEKKARREEWTIWLALLIGAIGALSGLIAIIKK
jgi:hypothetical protein